MKSKPLPPTADQVRHQRKISQQVQSTKLEEFKRAYIFARNNGTLDKFLSTLRPDQRELLNLYRQKVKQSEHQTASPGMTQNEYQQLQNAHDSAKKTQSIERSRRLRVKVLQGGSPGLKSR